MNWLNDTELTEANDMLFTGGTEEKEHFKITDLQTLNWAMRKLSVLDKKRAEEVAVTNAEIERIQQWFTKQDKQYQYSKEYLERLIGDYAETQRVEDPKWKGSKTPYGKINFHKQKDQWEYDEEALVAYLEKERKTSLLKVKKEPIKELIKDFFTLSNGHLINENTGEIVPGVTITEREAKLSIKLEG